MKMKHLSILFAFACLLASCDRLDIPGMLVSHGSHTEDRVAQWLAWDDDHGMPLITGVEDEYCVYVCSDIHITDSAPRVALFLQHEEDDPRAAFSIINGDVANESGEDPYRVLDSVLHLRHHGAPMEDTCFVVLGNHDIYFDCQNYYDKYFHTSTYYVTVQTVGGYKDLFVMLDSGNATHGRRQLEWLKALLSHRSDYRHVIVCSHTCLFRNSYDYSTTPAANMPEDETYELMSLMEQHHVELYLQGHFHHKECHEIGGVKYVMTDNLNEDVDAPSYLVVTCGEDVVYNFKNL